MHFFFFLSIALEPPLMQNQVINLVALVSGDSSGTCGRERILRRISGTFFEAGACLDKPAIVARGLVQMQFC